MLGLGHQLQLLAEQLSAVGTQGSDLVSTAYELMNSKSVESLHCYSKLPLLMQSKDEDIVLHTRTKATGY